MTVPHDQTDDFGAHDPAAAAPGDRTTLALISDARRALAAEESERAAMEDQARRWCDAQRELVPQWKAEDQVNRTADAVIDHLLKVNVILGQHNAVDVADVIVARMAPENDIEIVRSAAQRVGQLARAVGSRGQASRIGRVK